MVFAFLTISSKLYTGARFVAYFLLTRAIKSKYAIISYTHLRMNLQTLKVYFQVIIIDESIKETYGNIKYIH